MTNRLWMTLIILLCALPLNAQESTRPIAYDKVVSDSITDEVFFDWWGFEAEQGDSIFVIMRASDGLVPLIGLLDVNGDLVARSDDLAPPAENGVARLEYTADASDFYVIVATREGRDNGISTGSYELELRCGNCNNERINTRQEVEFRCGEMLVTTVLTLEFQEDIVIPENIAPDTDIEFYRLTVYGLDDFEPVIRAAADVQEGILDCTDDGRMTVGDQVNLPDGIALSIEGEESQTVQLTLRNPGTEKFFGSIVLNIGSINGAAGRYVAVLEGLSIHERGDEDGVVTRLGPLARDTDLSVYMVGDHTSRLDPIMYVLDSSQRCDDAGLAGCEDIPSFDGASVSISVAGGTLIQGDRFDAGLVLNPGNPDPISLVLGSRDNRTTGQYALVFIGELPAR